MICQHVMGVHISSSRNADGGVGQGRPTGQRRGWWCAFLHGLSGMPGADGNEDTGYVHSVYRSGDQSIILRPSLYPYVHALTFYFNYSLLPQSVQQSPEAIARMLCSCYNWPGNWMPAMKKYIQYCKARCSPRLSEEAGEVLTSSYVKIRDGVGVPLLPPVALAAMMQAAIPYRSSAGSVGASESSPVCDWTTKCSPKT
jgi:hypothetical protein